MASGIYIALSGATAQLDALDVNANNIANAGTPGFHAERARFAEALTRAASPDYVMARTDGTAVDLRPGRIADTGGKLDCAVNGDGWLVAQTPQGDRYTRAGNLRLDAARRLDAGDPLRMEASMCKLFVTEAAFRVADQAVQVHGGTGLIRGNPVEWLFRMLRMMRILTGTSEILRNTVAKELLESARGG